MSWCFNPSLLDQQNRFQQDLILGHAVQEEKDGCISDKKEKRMMHREVERQRRQEMANLYASLRSLLPLEYIKGKRSVSDHMHEAVNYIKHLEMNIKELEFKRNRQQKLTNSCGVQGERKNSDNCLANFVKLNLCSSGVEILINSCFREGGGFRLSRVLEVLLEEGLSVLTYTSTNMNDMLTCIIKLEVCDSGAVDLTTLQEKLIATVNDN